MSTSWLKYERLLHLHKQEVDLSIMWTCALIGPANCPQVQTYLATEERSVSSPSQTSMSWGIYELFLTLKVGEILTILYKSIYNIWRVALNPALWSSGLLSNVLPCKFIGIPIALEPETHHDVWGDESHGLAQTAHFSLFFLLPLLCKNGAIWHPVPLAGEQMILQHTSVPNFNLPDVWKET